MVRTDILHSSAIPVTHQLAFRANSGQFMFRIKHFRIVQPFILRLNRSSL
jgi:hypothetical protein